LSTVLDSHSEFGHSAAASLFPCFFLCPSVLFYIFSTTVVERDTDSLWIAIFHIFSLVLATSVGNLDFWVYGGFCFLSLSNRLFDTWFNIFNFFMVQFSKLHPYNASFLGMLFSIFHDLPIRPHILIFYHK
jgi:hypothetical protein